MSPTEDIAKLLRRGLRRLVIATGVLYLIVFIALVFVYVKQDRTQSALCALRGDVEKRIETSQTFLREHPNGTAGISAAVIKSSISNSQRTVVALSSLACS